MIHHRSASPAIASANEGVMFDAVSFSTDDSLRMSASYGGGGEEHTGELVGLSDSIHISANRGAIGNDR